MAATTFGNLIGAARFHLNEPKARFWSDKELLEIATRGATDLWAAINDLNKEHYLTVLDENSATPVTLPASATQLSNVPTDLFRVELIEPSDTTESGSGRDVQFVPRAYHHPDFVAARSVSPLDPSGSLIVFYTLTGAGAPTGAPIIRTAPKISSALTLRVAYVPTLGKGSYTVNTPSPIPAEADNAIIAWIVAFARAKERPENDPDPAWLTVYATEKQSLLTRMTPRQTQEPEYVDGMFENWN